MDFTFRDHPFPSTLHAVCVYTIIKLSATNASQYTSLPTYNFNTDGCGLIGLYENSDRPEKLVSLSDEGHDIHRERLSAVFSEVVIVDVLDSRDAANLALLQRPELGITFTKIHCWNLTQFEKCVFLDADTLVSFHFSV